ncbi:MAG: thiamine biosynthesis protein ThiF [Kineosporiaceae bacterium]
MRLQIKPGLVLVWRGPESAQIGLDPGRGIVLEGLTPPDRALLEDLSTGFDEAVLPDVVPGPGPDRSRDLVRLLAQSEVLVGSRAGRGILAQVARDAPRLAPDAAVWGLVYPDAGDGWELLAARRRRVVEVRGGGRTGMALASVLVAAGVGRVRLVERRWVQAADVGPAGAGFEDVGVPAAAATARAAGRLRPTGEENEAGDRLATPSGRPGASADVVVLVRGAVADSASAAPLLAGGVPHLSVVVRERGLVVGPLVLPGRGACLRCLDLHRADRDPAWPRVLAQLTGRASPTASEEAASALLGASLAALQVLCHLDGRARPAALGATLEVELPGGLASRRPWPPHPSCGCGRVAPAGQRERSEPATGRMGT